MVFLVVGLGSCAIATQPAHGISSLILILIAAVLMSGGAAVEALEKVIRELRALSAKLQHPAPPPPAAPSTDAAATAAAAEAQALAEAARRRASTHS